MVDPGSAVTAMSLKLNIPSTARTNVFPIKFPGYLLSELEERIESEATEVLSGLRIFPN